MARGRVQRKGYSEEGLSESCSTRFWGLKSNAEMRQSLSRWLPRLAYISLMLWWGVYAYGFYAFDNEKLFMPLLRALPYGEGNLAVAQNGLIIGIVLFMLCIIVGPGVEGGPPTATALEARTAPQLPLHVYCCRRCEHHAQWFDHHCIWMGTCIGRCNMRFFIAFSAFHIALCAYGGTLTCLYLVSIVDRVCGVDKEVIFWTRHLLTLGPPWSSPWAFPSTPRPSFMLFAAIRLYLGVSETDIKSGAMLLTNQLSHQAGSVAEFEGPGAEQFMAVILVREENCVINRRMAWALVFESQSLATISITICIVVVLWLGRILLSTMRNVCDGTTYFQRLR